MGITLSPTTARSLRRLLGRREDLNTQEGLLRLSPNGIEFVRLKSYLAGTIVDATAEEPIVIDTAAPHGLFTGDMIAIEDVLGNEDANGTWVITVLSGTSLELDGSIGNVAYAGGGSWTLVPDLSNGDGTVSDATNASPIVIETASHHHRTTGDVVIITGVLGNTAANGKHTITVVDDTHFELDGSTGNGTYITHGTWRLQLDHHVVDATNATPIVIETAGNHNRVTGDYVSISGVEGNESANGDWIITVLDDTHFELDTSSGVADYTEGGIWRPIQEWKLGNVVKYNTATGFWVPYGEVTLLDVHADPLQDGAIYLGMHAGTYEDGRVVFLTRRFNDGGVVHPYYSKTVAGITSVGDGANIQWARGPKGVIGNFLVGDDPGERQFMQITGTGDGVGHITLYHLFTPGDYTSGNIEDTTALMFINDTAVSGLVRSVVLVNGVFGVFQGSATGGSYHMGVENTVDWTGNAYRGGICTFASTAGPATIDGGTF